MREFELLPSTQVNAPEFFTIWFKGKPNLRVDPSMSSPGKVKLIVNIALAP